MVFFFLLVVLQKVLLPMIEKFVTLHPTQHFDQGDNTNIAPQSEAIYDVIVDCQVFTQGASIVCFSRTVIFDESKFLLLVVIADQWTFYSGSNIANHCMFYIRCLWCILYFFSHIL